ncbi:MAG: hypothetical protein HYY98_06475 [Burkholderiales bacterium]|nr:hypothetical protein [Burkholderiales bacterium]
MPPYHPAQGESTTNTDAATACYWHHLVQLNAQRAQPVPTPSGKAWR